MEKIKINDVATALGVSPETVRVGLQLGMYDFGIAFKKPGRQNYTYVLYPAKVAELVGELKQ
jgi:hypothetical protein